MTDFMLRTNRLTLTVGIPGCGKSHWADQQVRDFGAIRIERDLIREEVAGDRRRHTHEMDVTRIARQRAADALGHGRWVIISDTNLIQKYRKPWIALAEEFKAQVDYKVFDVPLETCLARNAERPDETRVPEEVILNMFAKMSLPVQP